MEKWRSVKYIEHVNLLNMEENFDVELARDGTTIEKIDNETSS